jgi:hypothetical protein
MNKLAAGENGAWKRLIYCNNAAKQFLPGVPGKENKYIWG